EIYKLEKLLTIKHWQPLTWIENEWNLGLRKLMAVFPHTNSTIWSDDANVSIVIRQMVYTVAYSISVGIIHRPRMKCSNLIVCKIGSNHRLSCEGLIQLLNELATYS
ncbi:MAG: hypothetical protein EBY99_02010, partial [Burkholderiaceae bacterium]|nr:hypothetical protein [Burkholderiaceae bacterium]